jgi:hypothetical protein
VLFRRFSARGLWAVAPDGHLVEFGVHEGHLVANQTGWPLAAVEGMTIACARDPRDPSILVIPVQTFSRGVPSTECLQRFYKTLSVPALPLLKRFQLVSDEDAAAIRRRATPAPRRPSPPTRRSPRMARARVHRRPEPTAVPQTRADRRDYKIGQLTWGDRHVTCDLAPGHKLPCAEAQAVFNVIKKQLQRRIGAPVSVEVNWDNGELVGSDVRPPVGLLQTFRRQNRTNTLRRIRRAETPVNVSEVLSALGHDDPADIIGDRALTDASREPCLRYLFDRVPAGRETYLWRDNALLLPLTSQQHGAIYAWEHLKESNATYLFRATSQDEMLDVVSNKQWRSALMGDPELRERCGYISRIVHPSDDLTEWTTRLHAHTGPLGG